MTYSLKPELQKFVEQQIKTGHYSSPDEVVADALTRLMDELPGELDEQTLAAIDESEDEIEQGKYHDWKDVSARLRSKYVDGK